MKPVTVSIVSPSICHDVVGLNAIILVFWMLSFKLAFSLSSFTFIKSLFSSSLLSAIRVVSSAYLRLLIFLPAVLIPACASLSPAFLIMYSAYKLNKQGDNGTVPGPNWSSSHQISSFNFSMYRPRCTCALWKHAVDLLEVFLITEVGCLEVVRGKCKFYFSSFTVSSSCVFRFVLTLSHFMRVFPF